MEIVSNKEEMVFRKDYNGKPIYTIGISKKDRNGTYINGYINCNFKKGIDIPNRTKIKINKAWLDFYKKDNLTIPTIFISEYDIVEEGNPFADFAARTESNIGEQIEISPDDLPF